MRYCSDCRYAKPDPMLALLRFFGNKEGWRYAKCLRCVEEDSDRFELVHPDFGKNHLYCSLVRKYGPCGKEGKMFEPK